MDEKILKLLITWLKEYSENYYADDLVKDVDFCYQQFLEQNKERLNQIKNLGESSSRLSAVRRSKSGVEITFTLSDDEFISLLEQKNLDKVVFDCGMRLPNPNDLLAIKITDIVMDAIKNNSKEYGLIDVRENT